MRYDECSELKPNPLREALPHTEKLNFFFAFETSRFCVPRNYIILSRSTNRFNSDGKRSNFSLDVVEMTPGSTLVKIGSWTDDEGLEITNVPLLHRGHVPNLKSIQ